MSWSMWITFVICWILSVICYGITGGASSGISNFIKIDKMSGLRVGQAGIKRPDGRLCLSLFLLIVIIFFFVHFFRHRNNGSLPAGDKGRKRSKYSVVQRTKPNGVQPANQYRVQTPQTHQVELERKMRNKQIRRKITIIEFTGRSRR